jgi:4-hydroxymandelate oxidase
MSEPINLHEYEELARAVLPKMVFDYFASGAGDQITLHDNRRAFDRIQLRPRLLQPVGQRDLRTTLFGKTLPSPILIAPMAFQKLAHLDGEPATVRAANAAGVTFVASTMATTSLEEIASTTTSPAIFQLYVFKEREVTRALVQRAEAAGFIALEVTGDVPVMGRREPDMRNGFHLSPEFTVKNLEEAGFGMLPIGDGESGPALYTRCCFDADLTWKDIEWLASLTKLPVLVKGVLRGDDAVRAIESGAAGVVVSNHGGRQLDTSPATIQVLPEVVEAIAGRGAVILDGGVRRGIDVVKALALGASAVQVGRPVLWGLATGGEKGAERVLTILRDEFDNAMALCGCSKVEQITRDLVKLP